MKSWLLWWAGCVVITAAAALWFANLMDGAWVDLMDVFFIIACAVMLYLLRPNRHGHK
jgi:hypothetical protein